MVDQCVLIGVKANMFKPEQVGKRTRYTYAKINEVIKMPHLLDIQRKSYEWFLESGLQNIFNDISPIKDNSGNLVLSFEGFSLGEPKYDINECKNRDATYAAPLRVNIRLVNNDPENMDIKEQEVFMGDFPLMTDTGTFIINGAERVIVSQLVRSPGVYYNKEIDTMGNRLYDSTVIPNRGAWIELETDASEVVAVRIDRNRKLPATVLVRALGWDTNESILDLFWNGKTDEDAGGTGLWPMIALSNIAQGSAVLAFYVMNRHDEREAQISLPAAISAYLGVTEPALFGVNLKYVYPFVAGMIGSGIAGLFCTSFNITANAIGIGGLPGILSIQAKYIGLFAIDMVIAIIIPFVLTFIFRRVGFLTKAEDEVKSDENSQVQAVVEAKKDAEVPAGTVISIQSPLAGRAKNLSEAPDPVFAQGVMGQGVVIEPTEGELVAPVDGVVSVLFPTKHAIGLVSDEGLELLMHIGMDTVNLDGDGFTAHVKQGDRVSVGDALISFDMAAIQAAGYPVATPVIVTNQNDFQTDVTRELPCDVARGEAIFTASKL